MSNKFLIWKIKHESTFSRLLDESLKKHETRYYTAAEADKAVLEACSELKLGIAVEFSEDSEIQGLFLFEIISIDSEERKLTYQTVSEIRHRLVIDNLKACLEMDLKTDFGARSYLSVEQSKDIYEQLCILKRNPYCHERNDKQSYEEIDEEKHLSELSQKNQYCERIYGTMASQEGRGEFQRDYDRIVHSKAFRRMVDKAQIFSASKGDYYRTRMTHTLTVDQIAKGICNALRLNTYLTEAIALGHDLGHTPFGHQGERTLDRILKDDLETVDANIKYGGFKHNYQTLRTVCYLEEQYAEFEGLDLSFQTMEGMWKHTKTKYNTGEFELGEFFPEKYKDKLYPELKYSSTLEGQIVAIADEIAQRGHDLDDAFSAGLITFEDLNDYLSLKKMQVLQEKVEKSVKEVERLADKNRIFVDKQELQQNRAVSEVISYFIKDVIEASDKKIREYSIEKFEADGYRVKDQLICFSQEGKCLNDYLEKIITRKVINSSEVVLFDDKASKIVKGLFNAYYNNPQLLHKGTLRKIYRDYREKTENIIDFQNGDSGLIKEEWKKITSPEKNLPENVGIDEYRMKRKILVRNICDFISGMTDSYAKAEYEKIYGMK